MTETQNMQNTQQQQETQQQELETYINPEPLVFRVNLQKELGIVDAEISVYISAALIKEIAKRKVNFKNEGLEIVITHEEGYGEVARKIIELIKKAAIKKVVQSGKLDRVYSVTLHSSDIDFTEVDKLIEEITEKIKREEEEKRRKEEEKRRKEEEAMKMIKEIEEIIKQLPEEIVELWGVGHAYLYVGEKRVDLHFNLGECSYESIKQTYETLKNLNISELLNLRISALKEKIKELKESLEEKEKDIEMLKKIIRKLTSEEELEEKLEELEEEEESELTKEEIKYLLGSVFDC
jgi:hypothetical protein